MSSTQASDRSMPGGSLTKPTLLLAEPQFIVRRTVAAVAKELSLATIHEATSVDAAARLLSATPFDALLIDLDTEGEALELLMQLRAGQLRASARIPVAVMSSGCDSSTVTRLVALGIQRVVVKPFKVKTLLEAVAALSRTSSAAWAGGDEAAA